MQSPVFTDTGDLADPVTPRALELEEIPKIIDQYHGRSLPVIGRVQRSHNIPGKSAHPSQRRHHYTIAQLIRAQCKWRQQLLRRFLSQV